MFLGRRGYYQYPSVIASSIATDLNKCWCRHVLSGPSYGNQVRTRDWLPTVPGPTQRKKPEIRSWGESVS